MAVETVLLSGLGTLLIALGYVIVKKFRRSHCSSHTKCCDFVSPEIKVQQEHTERYDTILEMINRIKPLEGGPESPGPRAKAAPVTPETTTTSNLP